MVQAANDQLQLELPAGFSGRVTVRFTEPFRWCAAEIVSLACILCGDVIQLISHNRTKHKNGFYFIGGICTMNSTPAKKHFTLSRKIRFTDALPWVWLVLAYCITLGVLIVRGEGYIDSDMSSEMVLAD